jgi:hypothetical protein
MRSGWPFRSQGSKALFPRPFSQRNLCPGKSLSRKEGCARKAGQGPLRVFRPRRRVRAWYGPEMFDAQGRRSVESLHFPPSGLDAVCLGGRGERGRGEYEESMSLRRSEEGAGRMSMQKERTKI